MAVRKNRLSPLLKNIITSGMDEKYNIETMRKVMLLNVISVTGVIFIVPLGIVAYIQAHFPLGFFDHVAALLLLLNLFYLRNSETPIERKLMLLF
ncbi:MAG: hypothetical protein SWH54_14995 [Thermodesulfobacteriota bacterium]|nr:hypothetical protein [Thermodesulfobacteriota bacterium]